MATLFFVKNIPAWTALTLGITTLYPVSIAAQAGAQPAVSSSPADASGPALYSSSAVLPGTPGAKELDPAPAPAQATPTRISRDEIVRYRPGIEAHIGLNGIGGDIAFPIARRFNVRVGGQYFKYSGSFTEEGANIDAALRVGNGKAGVDWFPFGNGFRISPQVMFALQTEVRATVLVPAGQQIDLDGGTYTSSAADPLHGSARITTRRAAPGISIGWGNISPRRSRRWSVPVEVGFYYIGQPSLQVDFAGSACDRGFCQTVTTDPGFQRDLEGFIRRQNNNLSYASFFPIAQVGFGYRF